MSNTPHELHEEFPEHAERLHDLKISNKHFARLADQYHDVNREIHRMETDIEAASDQRMSERRKERLRLKDEIAAMLNES